MAEDDPLPPIPPATPPAFRWLPRPMFEGMMIGTGWAGEQSGGAVTSALFRGYWPFLAGGLALMAVIILARRR